MLLSSFVHSHFSYAPLVWMFHTRDIQNKIDSVHKKALRILFNEPDSNFGDLLIKDGGCTNHMHNIQLLMIEMFKAQNNLEPSLLKDVFEKSDYKGPALRTDKYFKTNLVKSDSFGLNSLQIFGVRLWKLLPDNIKYSISLSLGNQIALVSYVQLSSKE